MIYVFCLSLMLLFSEF